MPLEVRMYAVNIIELEHLYFDAVMPPYVFLLHMAVPSIVSWLVTTLWLERCWLRSRKEPQLLGQESENRAIMVMEDAKGSNDAMKRPELTLSPKKLYNPLRSTAYGKLSPAKETMKVSSEQELALMSPSQRQRSFSDGDTVHYAIMSAAKSGAESEGFVSSIVHIVASPFPYAMIVLLAIMIAMIFIDLMSIAGLVCISAAVMVTSTVLGNHWRGRAIWAPPSALSQPPLTSEEKIKNTNKFFDQLFESIDYSLLLIFMGNLRVQFSCDSLSCILHFIQGFSLFSKMWHLRGYLDTSGAKLLGNLHSKRCPQS